MKTIGKNTKEYALVKNLAVIQQGISIKRFDLRNGFKAVLQKGIEEIDFKIGRLTKNNDTYTLKVHSNLWFELTNI